MHHGFPHNRSLAALVAMSVALAPSVSFAQSNEERALALYEQATQAYGEGNYRQAADLLAKAFAYDNNLIYQYNRILALQANGDYSEALELVKVYEDPMKDDPESRFTDIPDIRSKLESQVAAKKKAEEDKKNNTGNDTGNNGDGNANNGNGNGNGDVTDPGDTTKPGTKTASTPVLGYTLAGVGGAVLLTGGLMSTCVFVPNCLADPDTLNPGQQLAVQDGIEQQIPIAAGLLVVGALTTGVGVFLIATHEDDAESSSFIITPTVGPDGAGAAVFGRF